jgi:hypothetical protein
MTDPAIDAQYAEPDEIDALIRDEAAYWQEQYLDTGPDWFADQDSASAKIGRFIIGAMLLALFVGAMVVLP